MLTARPAQLDADGAPHRPPGHSPNVPAWTAVPADPRSRVVYAQFGVQHPGSEASPAGTALAARLRGLLAGDHAPAVVDLAYEIDPAGHRNDVVIAYWATPAEELAWRERDDVGRLWSAPLDGAIGLWRELLRIPADRFETLHSTDRGGQGVSGFTAIEPTRVHEYNGAARDRIAASRHDPLDRAPRAQDAGAPAPDNVCFIRTAQDWSRCAGPERAIYLEHVAPALERGTRFLQDHPAETGCLSGRFVREVDADGAPLDRSCFLAFFASLGDLERWTWSHETHAAIFGSFMDLVVERGGVIDLALWHEVCVLDGDSVEIEYRNCHSGTGLSPR
jgi:Haem-containing dehydratase